MVNVCAMAKARKPEWIAKICLLFILFSVLIPGAPVWGANWTRDALRLTGESNFVRDTAIRNLRRTPRIAELLVRELRGPRRSLALDAITALRLTALVPKLLEFAVVDETGQSYLAVDSLITADNITEVLRVYRERLLCQLDSKRGPSSGSGLIKVRSCPETPDAAKIVMLETLGRTETALAADDLARLFDESDYEIRSAVLRYLRRSLLDHHRQDYARLVQKATSARPAQIRRQALSVLEEIKSVPTRGAVRL